MAECYDCELEKVDTVERPCPFGSEILDDWKLLLLCDDCYDLRGQEI